MIDITKYDENTFFIRISSCSYCSPGFKHVTWACRDRPRPLPTPKTFEKLGTIVFYAGGRAAENLDLEFLLLDC